MLSTIISTENKYSLALFLEPHLPLIKSGALNQIYRELRYERESDYKELIALLEEHAKKDYRLRKLLDSFIKKFKNESANEIF
jgi:hypothetical protein